MITLDDPLRSALALKPDSTGLDLTCVLGAPLAHSRSKPAAFGSKIKQSYVFDVLGIALTGDTIFWLCVANHTLGTLGATPLLRRLEPADIAGLVAAMLTDLNVLLGGCGHYYKLQRLKPTVRPTDWG